MPDPTLRASSQTTGGSGTSISVAVPTGTTDGDGLLLHVWGYNPIPVPAITTPTGWTLKGSGINYEFGSYGVRHSIFEKDARAASESGNYTVNFASSVTGSRAWCGAFQDVKATGSFVGNVSENFDDVQTTTGLSISLTAGSLLLLIATDWTGAGNATPPSGMTNVATNALGMIAYQAGLSGATGDKTFTNTNAFAGDPFTAIMLEILAAAGGGSASVTPPTGAVELDGFAPTVTVTQNAYREIPTGYLEIGGFAPTVTASSTVSITVPTGAIELDGFAPTVTATDHRLITVPPGAIELDGFAPTVTGDPLTAGGSGQSSKAWNSRRRGKRTGPWGT